MQDGLRDLRLELPADGLGIGRTIVRTIVEAHGGRIDTHNHATAGATFTVTLPCSEDPNLQPS